MSKYICNPCMTDDHSKHEYSDEECKSTWTDSTCGCAWRLMGMEKVYEIPVEESTTLPSAVKGGWQPYQTSDTFGNISTSNTIDYNWWVYPQTIYMYQVRCPKRGCKTDNWLQLDTITPCKKCGSHLKAVSMKADFEIEVG